MRFAYPWALLLALPAAAAVWWTLTGADKRRNRLPFPGAGRLASAARWPAARWLPPALRGAALVLLAAGLARPQRVTSRIQTTGRGIDIMMALDTSLSMSALDFQPNRLEAAKDTARRFVMGRVQDRIGLVIFGGASQLACPLTVDYDAVHEQLQSLSPGMTQTEGTALGDGIASAVNHLSGSEAKSRVVILLTDGRSNTGLIDPITAAKTAAAYGIKIYTIGTAQRGVSVIPIDDPVQGRVMARIEDDLDEDLLSEVARLTEGRFFRATSLKQLRDIYATIDKLEKSKVELPPVVSRDDLYRPLVVAAILLLLAEIGLSSTLMLRWP